MRSRKSRKTSILSQKLAIKDEVGNPLYLHPEPVNMGRVSGNGSSDSLPQFAPDDYDDIDISLLEMKDKYEPPPKEDRKNKPR